MSIYALAKPVYKPAMRVLLSITNSFPALVTTSIDGVTPADNGYITGTIVRLDIPDGFGMTQANQKFGTITVVTPSTFTIDIDTTHFDTFITPSNWPYSYQRAQVVPFAEQNDMLTAAVQNVL